MRTPKLPQALFNLWRMGQNSTVHRAMINLKTAFQEYAFEEPAFQIPVAQPIAQVLSSPPA